MIETHDLSREYGPKVALSGLNLRVEPGKFLGFLGPNGAGKSTTVKSLNLALTLAGLASFPVFTQAPSSQTAPAFDVASVKLNTSGEDRS